MPPLAASSPLVPESYQEVLRNRYQLAFQHSTYEPFVWPYRALGPYLLIFYLLVPPSKSQYVYLLRFPVFLAIVYLSAEAILQCRSPLVTMGYGIGLLNAFAILWSATLLIFNDGRADFRRIEGRRMQSGAKGEAPTATGHAIASEHANGEVMITGGESDKGTTLRAGPVCTVLSQKGNNVIQANKGNGNAEYVWQGLPSSFVHRLDWVTDLVCSFRGPRWSYRISGMTPPPPRVQKSLNNPALKPPTPESHLTRADLIRYNLPRLFILIFLLDGLKTLAMRDPYFWSLGSQVPSPFPHPRLSRTLMSAIMIYFSLQGVFVLAPLVFGVLLGPELIGEHSWPWMYTSFFGSIREISKHGLAGAWGRWWHQLFRYAFEQGGEFVARILGGEAHGWGKKNPRGVFLRTVVAFMLSGTLHACASYTSMLPTKPLRPWLFFAIQPVGLLGQQAVTSWMRKTGWRERLPWWLREMGNFAFVFIWFYVTGPLVADDFAATGIWLYEPVPFSVFRGLSGKGWWFWAGTWMSWHSADQWWKSGLAF